jgi:hypothetical protein
MCIKYKKFIKLYNELIKINKNNYCCCLSFICFFKTISTILKANYRQYKMKKKHKNEIKYYFQGNKYIILINKNKLPFSRIIDARDNNNNDITEQIKQFAGPFENFHNMDISPSMIDLNKVIIKIINEDDLEIEIKEFNNNEIININ